MVSIKEKRIYALRMLCIVTFAVFSFVFTSRMQAQSTASVAGRVADPSGAVIPGTQVTIRDTATNVLHSTVADGAGHYAVPSIPPGQYDISASKTGFSTTRVTDIRLTVGQAAIFNLTLQPGNVQQTVTVHAQSSGVQTASAGLGVVIDRRTIVSLPLSGRNFTQLLTLTPGVSTINHSTIDTLKAIGTAVIPAVDGQRNRSNMFYLDGANDIGSYESTYNYEPIVDDIQEFRVLTHTDQAQYGGVTGGIISVVSRSGTNQYHGTLWEFLRNSVFDAKSYFSGKLNPVRWNQFGGVVGGPVWIPKLYNGHNRTFFFFAYEGYRQSQQEQAFETTPTAAQLGGDFSALCQSFNSSGICTSGTQLYDPHTTRPDPNKPGSFLRTPFPYNNISSELSPAAVLYSKTIFPAPNLSTPLPGGQNLLDNSPLVTKSNSYSGRIDQSFGTHDLLYGRISHFNEPYTAAAGNPNGLQSAVVNGWNDTVHEVHTFGPRSIAEVFFGRNIGTQTTALLFPNAPKDFPTTLIGAGFSSNFISSFAGAQPSVIPQIQVNNYLGNNQKSLQTINYVNSYEYGGSYTRIVGRNTIKAGGSVSTDNFFRTVELASATTDIPQTGNLESPKNTGDALASFLVGVPSAAEYSNGDYILKNGWVDGAYAQDQIQVRPDLTVNVGLRYDISIWPKLSKSGSAGGYGGNFNLTTGNYEINAVPPACSASQGAPCIPGGVLPAHVIVAPYGNRALHSTDNSNLSWRFGLAYHPWPKTSFLAGYGRFYDEWATVVQLSQTSGGTWPSVDSLALNPGNTTTVTNPLTDPFHQGSAPVTTPATPFKVAAYYYDPHLKEPRSDQWNVGLEQGFGANTVLKLTYVGATGSHLTQGILDNKATYPAPGPISARQPFPYAVPSNYNTDNGRSNYQALQASLQHVTGNGLTYLLAYTWSKSIDNGCSGSFDFEGCQIQNTYDLASARAVSDYDLPNIVSFSMVYALPYGQGRRFRSQHRAVNEILGGWALTLDTSYTSGSPLTPEVHGDSANVGGNFVLPNQVGNPIPAHQTATEWFDPSALVAPPPFTFGDFPRNSIRGPHNAGNVNLGVHKLFPIYRESALEFRAEAFNALNHFILANPNVAIGNKAFGTITSGSEPRTMEFALKLHF